MKRILIAESSEILAGALERVLRARYEVHVCHAGGDALRLLNDLQPDGLIINLCLHGTDGLTVLKKAKHIPPAILALTYIMNDSITHAAASCGAGGIVLLPCAVRSIVQQLGELMQP